MVAPTSRVPSSRESEEGAGWRNCSGPGGWIQDVPPGTKPMSWLRPSILWRSRNEVIASVLTDPVPAARARWVELARKRAEETGASTDFVVSCPSGDTASVLVIGDPGEGDNSQYAVVPTLVEQSKTADLAVICSDVIYPAGDYADYPTHFHRPYRNIRIPIYGLPGNHDWYDGLHALMHQFCRLHDPDYEPVFGRGFSARLARLLWRKPGHGDLQEIAADDTDPATEVPPPNPIQPGPYFAIDAGPVRFVGIDTGITGKVDPEQYEWLKRVSFDAPERPKILLTGKPLYVDNKYRPWPAEGTQETVDQVVTDPRANYVMAIGADIHNYQRYPVRLSDGRTIQYLVSGGGGAYMHATHPIPPVNVNGVTEGEFRCYPLRRDSLARFSQVIAKRLFLGRLTIEPTVAAQYYADRGIVSFAKRSPEGRLPFGQRFKAALVRRFPSGRLFHRYGSEAFDFDTPPFFKNFVRVDATRAEITVTCFGITGCADTEYTPSIEDQFTITL